MMDKSKYVPLKQYESYDKNPFVKELIQDGLQTRMKIVGKSKAEEAIISLETGEVTDKTMILNVVKEVDKGKFVKVYEDAIKRFYDLGKPAIAVWNYALGRIEMNKDTIDLYLSDMEEAIDYSKATIIRGVSQLISAGFIAKTDKISWYYINPKLVWNGDRVALVQQFIRHPDEKDEDDNTPLLAQNHE